MHIMAVANYSHLVLGLKTHSNPIADIYSRINLRVADHQNKARMALAGNSLPLSFQLVDIYISKNSPNVGACAYQLKPGAFFLPESAGLFLYLLFSADYKLLTS